MANVVIPENPEFNEALRIIETKDLVHADVVNPMFRTLLLNTVYLERRVAKMIERIDTLAIDNTYGGPELSADANIVDASAQFSVIRKQVPEQEPEQVPEQVPVQVLLHPSQVHVHEE